MKVSYHCIILKIKSFVKCLVIIYLCFSVIQHFFVYFVRQYKFQNFTCFLLNHNFKKVEQKMFKNVYSLFDYHFMELK